MGKVKSERFDSSLEEEKEEEEKEEEKKKRKKKPAPKSKKKVQEIRRTSPRKHGQQQKNSGAEGRTAPKKGISYIRHLLKIEPNEKIDAGIKPTNWSDEEKARLLEGIKKHGPFYPVFLQTVVKTKTVDEIGHFIAYCRTTKLYSSCSSSTLEEQEEQIINEEEEQEQEERTITFAQDSSLSQTVHDAPQEQQQQQLERATLKYYIKMMNGILEKRKMAMPRNLAVADQSVTALQSTLREFAKNIRRINATDKYCVDYGEIYNWMAAKVANEDWPELGVVENLIIRQISDELREKMAKVDFSRQKERLQVISDSWDTGMCEVDVEGTLAMLKGDNVGEDGRPVEAQADLLSVNPFCFDDLLLKIR